MKITISATVTRKLGNLVDVFLHDGYFATAEAAYKYVDGIYDFIFSIEKQTARKTRNGRNGSFYIVYKVSSETTWYITFNITEDSFFIKNITNNHSSDYLDFV